MRFRLRINQTLNKLGYSLVRQETLARLIESSMGPGCASDLGPERPEALPKIPPDVPLPTVAKRNLKLVTAANQPPRNCTALAAKFEAGSVAVRFALHVAEFQQKGITVIGTSPQKAASWRETESFERDVSNRHSAWDWAGAPILPFSEDIRTGIPSAALTADLQELLSGPDFEAFFRGVLGCPATVVNCRLVKSLPHAATGIGPQSWHQDGCPPGVIRGVLYLTDVDEKTGPFQYRDNTGAERTLLGKTGDLLIFDAMRLLHRAMPPERRVRSAIDLVFMPRLPGQPFKVIVAGMNHWPADPFFFLIPADRSEIVASQRVRL